MLSRTRSLAAREAVFLLVFTGLWACREGELVAEPGVGEFVERAAFGQELLPAAAR